MLIYIMSLIGGSPVTVAGENPDYRPAETRLEGGEAATHSKAFSFARHNIHTETETYVYFYQVRNNCKNLGGAAWPDAVGPIVWGNSYIYWGQGGWSFTNSQISTPSGIYGTTMDDFDGDGDQDIAGATAWDGTVWWYRNDGGSFTVMTTIATSDFPNHVHSFDLDGDGDRDLAWTCELSGFFVSLNNGSGSFTNYNIYNTMGAETAWPADLDGDGDIDLAGATHSYSGGPNALWWFECTGPGSYTPHQIASIIDPHGVWAGDMDGDGDKDILTVTNFFNMGGDNSVWLYRNNGYNNFAPVYVGSIAYGSDVKAADLDLDGDMDIVASGGGADEEFFYNHGELAAYENNGGIFTKQVLSTNGSYGLWIGDYDLDGCPDISAIDHPGYNDGAATFIIFENLIPDAQCMLGAPEEPKPTTFRVIPGKGGLFLSYSFPGSADFWVHDITGREVASGQLTGDRFVPVGPGVYVVSATVAGTVIHQKGIAIR